MQKSLFSILVIVLFSAFNTFSQEVFINEFQASNASTVTDPDFAEQADWIELYNAGVDAVDLSGWYLTDVLEDTIRWSFPADVSINPGEFLLVWADGQDIQQTNLHTNFKLSIGGERIGLFTPSRVLMDSAVYGQQIQDISFGRQPDGGPEWHLFDSPTPGSSNITTPYLKARVPEFSIEPGFYTSSQTLEISTVETGATIRYTLDSSEPDELSPLYTEAISLGSRVGDENVFSEIRTNLDPHHWLPDWVPPAGEVFKANVVRARAYRDGYEPSDIMTFTCFIDEGIHERYPTLPVISIVSDSKHLFDYNTGIYVPGATHVNGDEGSGNYFQDWEKPAHIAFFEPGGQLGFAQDVGLSIQGGTSPASPQKGLHIIARSDYGKNRISFPIFQEDPSKAKELTEYKRFIIRAWGSLITGSLFNDAYAHRLMAESDVDIQAYQPAVVFIDGEYWGLHELREANKNSWYYQYHYDIDRDNPGFDLLQHTLNNGLPYAYVDEGDAQHWNNMMSFLRSNDMTRPENYEYLKTQMDIDNFIAYLWHCIYVGKWDWPNNNDASWKPRTFDGKWKWTQFDMETGFGVATSLGPQYASLGPQLNMIKAVVEGVDIPGFGKYGPHPIMARIYKNEEFMDDFANWYYEHRNHEFHPDTMNTILDEMAAEIRPYMTEYKHRWPFIGAVREDWETSLEMIKEYNRVRPDYVQQHLWGLTSTESYIPLEYKLLQNYPNPFSHTTFIEYQLPRGADVRLRLYNTQGQLIHAIDQHHHSGGHFSIDLNDAQLSPGVYFCTMEADDYSDVIKLFKVKKE